MLLTFSIAGKQKTPCRADFIFLNPRGINPFQIIQFFINSQKVMSRDAYNIIPAASRIACGARNVHNMYCVRCILIITQ